MKKPMNKIKSFFENVWNKIDKYIIVPITKLILKLTGHFDKSSKKIENWLSKSTTLLFISLILAILTFIVIDQKILLFVDNSAEVLQNQPVKAIYNEEAYVVEGLPETVDITLIGTKTDLYIAKQSSSHDVTVDLSGLKPGTHKVSVDYNKNTGNIDYMVNPSTITVVIYPKVSETMTLSTDILNQESLDTKLVIDKISYNTDKVVIKGADHQIKKVAEVKALINLNNLVSHDIGTNTMSDVPLKAYDANGDVVDVETVPNKISVDVVISSPSKQVPIKVIPKGDVSFGLGIKAIELSNTNIVVYGKSDVLDKLTYVPVEIDVKDLKEDKKFKIEIPKPIGVKSLSVNSLTINVVLDSATSADFKNININSRNLASGYTVQGLNEEATKVDVTVKGVKSVISSLTASDITAYVDLSGYGPGEHEVEVQVEGTDPKLQYISKTKKVKIKIK